MTVEKSARTPLGLWRYYPGPPSATARRAAPTLRAAPLRLRPSASGPGGLARCYLPFAPTETRATRRPRLKLR